MLRAVLAGVIPLLIYFVLILGNWPGLDVVAIHISVFLAAALVMYALSQFRRRGKRMHWAPKLLIAFFSGLVVFNAGLLYVANSGLPEPIGRWWMGGEGKVYSGFSGVVAHDQAAAKAVSSELSESYRESRFGWQVETDAQMADGILHVMVRVRDRTGLPVDHVRGEIQLIRPGTTNASTQLALAASDAGVYQGALALPAAGRWLLDTRLYLRDELRHHGTQEINQP
jgi:nitrogen fixation protein FixH